MAAAHGPRTTAINVPPIACAVVPPGTGTLNIMMVKLSAEKIASSGTVRLLRTFLTFWVATAHTGTVGTASANETAGARYPSGMCNRRLLSYRLPIQFAIATCCASTAVYAALGIRHNRLEMTDRQVPLTTPDAAEGLADNSPWDGVAGRLRASGLRWTPQRRTLVDVLRERRGHVTATELISRCRQLDRTTTPSTVYRTLDVLEELGLVKHGHGPGGREEYHVLPDQVHGHLYCVACGA